MTCSEYFKNHIVIKNEVEIDYRDMTKEPKSSN